MRKAGPNRRKLARGVGVGLSLAWGVGARADVIYVSQVRYIYGETSVLFGPPLQQDRRDAGDFGVFNQAVDLHYPSPGNEFEIARIVHASTLAPDGISFSWDAEADGTPPHRGGGSPRGLSVLDVTFDVTAAQPYHLAITMDLAWLYFYDPNRPVFSLVGPGVHLGDDLPSSSHPPVLYARDLSGVLEPGRYRLQISGSAWADPFGYPYASHISAIGALQLPAPAGGLIFAAFAARRRRELWASPT